ncbi:MAG: peptide deformylase [candidate division WOR-3 bacterium]|nr:MAG: peptide deformylase [candidate division WOR-3 bacterium]
MSPDASPDGRACRVVLYGNPVLRRKAAVIEDVDSRIRRFLADLKATMLVKEGLGLAANQIAVPMMAFAIDPRAAGIDAPPYCVLNPRIEAAEGTVEREEGCLSLPGLYEVLNRPEKVVVTGIDEQGRPVRIEVEGTLARAFSHEIDHLNGVLFIDHIGETRRKLLAGPLRELEQQEAAACG